MVGSLGSVQVGANAIDIATLLLGAAMPFIAMRFPLAAALLSKLLPAPPAPGPTPAPSPTPGPAPEPPTPSPAQPDLGLLLKKYLDDFLEKLGERLKPKRKGDLAEGDDGAEELVVVQADGKAKAFRVVDAVGNVRS